MCDGVINKKCLMSHSVSLARALQQIILSRERATIPAVNSDTNENIIPLLMLAGLPYRRLAENHVHKHPPIRNRDS